MSKIKNKCSKIVKRLFFDNRNKMMDNHVNNNRLLNFEIINKSVITRKEWDDIFLKFIVGKNVSINLANELLQLYLLLEDENPDFKYIGTTGIGNATVIYLAAMLKQYHLACNKAYDTELSLCLTRLSEKESRKKFRLNIKYKNVLVISQQGVGDELRNVGFYHYINAENIDVVIDPRFESVLYNDNKFNYIYYKQARPGFDNNPIVDGLLPRVIPNSITDKLSSYDLIVTSTELIFSIKGQIRELKRHFLSRTTYSKVNCQKKIGFIWRSDFVNKKREKEFLNIKNFGKLISTFPDFTFIPLVVNVNNKEKKYLSQFENVHFFDDKFDLYNDFSDVKKFIESLDAVVGISSFILEMMSAMNGKVFILSPTAQGFYFRATLSGQLGKANIDYLSLGSKVISPNSYDQPKAVITDELIDNLIKELYYEFKTIYKE